MLLFLSRHLAIMITDMREIKFRARRIDNNRWVYGDYFKTPLTDENSGTKPDAGWFFLTGETRHCIRQNNVAFTVDEKTVGESTGLKDKNGKEIFEKDLIRDDAGFLWCVEFGRGEFYLLSKEK